MIFQDLLSDNGGDSSDSSINTEVDGPEKFLFKEQCESSVESDTQKHEEEQEEGESVS